MELNTKKQVQEALLAKRKIMAAVLEEAGEDLDFSKVKSLPDRSEGDKTLSKVENFNALDRELNDLQDQYDTYLKAEKAVEDNRKALGVLEQPTKDRKESDDRIVKTIGEIFTESKQYQDMLDHDGSAKFRVNMPDANLKTLMETGAGFAPQSIRTGRVVEEALAPVEMLDLVNITQTSQNAVVFMEETTVTDNAQEVAEGGTYGEAEIVYTQQTQAVEEVGVTIPVTRIQFEDAPMVAGLVDRRLIMLVRRRVGSQILNGSGSTPSLLGVDNVSGLQTHAKGADDEITAILGAMTDVQVTGQAEPSLITMHPTNWKNIRSVQTSDGIFIYGHPSETGPMRLWGLPVASLQAETAGTAHVGDWRVYHDLYMRRGVQVESSDSHDTTFVEGTITLRCTIRVASVFYRGAAFVEVTGLSAS